ncbi:MAG: nucleotidyltransferase domain-containing protein [Candidatus Rokubacteria bacterium]|nr:nucleotidyltransferase domain-containing protein [Candidatus Rokubacteria bacterium]
MRLASLFGSLMRGEARPKSDADIAVLFSGSPPTESLDRLVADLEAASGRGVDLVVQNDAPPLLAHEVVSTGTCLVCRDEDERVRFMARTVSRYLDTAHLRRVQHAYLRERTEARRARPR